MNQDNQAKTTIEVSQWNPQTYNEHNGGPGLVRVEGEEKFGGDLVGEGSFTFLQVLAADGSASFVGTERFIGSLKGKKGSFVLQDEGKLSDDGHVSGDWFVVPGSATGELAGLQGKGGFKARLGEHAEAYLDYSLE